jgi:hypothetical protein
MNPKLKITKYAAEQLGLATDEKSLKKLIPAWWQNPRTKEKGGLGLTEQGFECLTKADIKCHKVVFDEPTSALATNSFTLWVDRNIDCPFFITRKEIYLFGERMAVQLVLFSGDLQKMQRAQRRFKENQDIA